VPCAADSGTRLEPEVLTAVTHGLNLSPAIQRLIAP
jgi:hypothetical protein